MPQLQAQMERDDVEECDFSSLRVDDATGNSEWVVIRVHRSKVRSRSRRSLPNAKKYWKLAYRVLCEFARAVLSGARPPPKVRFFTQHGISA
jgi:hypothetical protein